MLCYVMNKIANSSTEIHKPENTINQTVSGENGSDLQHYVQLKWLKYNGASCQRSDTIQHAQNLMHMGRIFNNVAVSRE